MTEIPYWQQRRNMKLGSKPTARETREKKKAKGVYFANQIMQSPQFCENCGADLSGTKAINPAAIVAHIIEKNETSGCPSVALHPLNRWFACGDCHTHYDRKGADFVQKMPIFPELVERVKRFYFQIDPKERRRVPEYFRPHDKSGKSTGVAAKGGKPAKVVRGKKTARRTGKAK